MAPSDAPGDHDGGATAGPPRAPDRAPPGRAAAWLAGIGLGEALAVALLLQGWLVAAAALHLALCLVLPLRRCGAAMALGWPEAVLRLAAALLPALGPLAALGGLVALGLGAPPGLPAAAPPAPEDPLEARLQAIAAAPGLPDGLLLEGLDEVLRWGSPGQRARALGLAARHGGVVGTALRRRALADPDPALRAAAAALRPTPPAGLAATDQLGTAAARLFRARDLAGLEALLRQHRPTLAAEAAAGTGPLAAAWPLWLGEPAPDMAATADRRLAMVTPAGRDDRAQAGEPAMTAPGAPRGLAALDLPREAAAGPLAAGAWLGPPLLLCFGAVLGWLAGAGPDIAALLAPGLAASLLAGAPAAMLAGLCGRVTGTAGLAAALAGSATLALLAAPFGVALALPEAVPAAVAAAGCAVLWAGLGTAAARGQASARPLAAGALIGLGTAGMVGGAAGALGGLALGAATAGLALAAPGALASATAAPVTTPPGGLAAAPDAPSAATPRGTAGPLAALAGLALAGGALAAPVAAWLRDDPLAVPALAWLVALPGLAVLAGSRGGEALRLATPLLGLQALAAALALAVAGAPAAAGLVAAEDLGALRLAILGAAFLPGVAALLAALLAEGACGRAALAALPLALPLAALAPGLPQGEGIDAWIAFAAPVAATAAALGLLTWPGSKEARA